MSDTIIMFENGKAVGGEGHPTDADEITFNNEDTGLVSEDVESAIKEVNAKTKLEYVEVVTDGVKTRSQCLNALYALIDESKLTPKSVIVALSMYGTRAIDYQGYYFSHVQGSVSGFTIAQWKIAETGSTMQVVSCSPNATPTVADQSSAVDSAGRIYRIYY